MKKAIFTICAKNYLAQAKTLGYSVKRFCPQADFFILLSDEGDGFDLRCEDFVLIQAKNIGIPDYCQMAYKYDVIEFSTSVKPFFLDKLINEQGYEKVLYIDPDMVVYHPLNFLFEALDSYDAILTPHLLKPYIKYDGATAEEELLFVGIYNLGFFAINNSITGQAIIGWWKEKLKNQCYADKEDALHVDQKWMDFLPALFTNQVLISRDPGLNIAFWNMHERHFGEENDKYLVDGIPLKIFHFSGLDAHEFEKIARKQTKFSLTNKPEYSKIFNDYVALLRENDLEYYSSLPYSYNQYENGVFVLRYQRRLFRGLNQSGENYTNPFSIEKGSYYQLLVNNRLMIEDSTGKYYAVRKGIKDVNSRIERFLPFLRVFQRTIGIKRYFLFMKFWALYSRFEKQQFLLKKKDD